MPSLGRLIMPLYLFVGTIANLAFLYNSFRDFYAKRTSNSVALFSFSVASISWVLPCWIQCTMVFFDDTSDWTPSKEVWGCDLMGFYSVFSSLAGMSLAVLISYLTFNSAMQKVVPTRFTIFVSFCIYIISMIFALFPFMGVGEYKFSGEGFCYFDFLNTTHIVILESISMYVLFFFF